MTSDIALFLVQDGLISGAIYALVGVALVLIFSLTRVIAVFVGEFVAYGALTLIALQADRVPQVIWILLIVGLVTGSTALFRRRRHLTRQAVVRYGLGCGIYPVAVTALIFVLAPMQLPLAVDALLTFLVIVPLAGYLYALVFEPSAEASVLTLLIMSMGVHLVMLGLGLLIFGPDGLRSPALASGSLDLGLMRLSGQQVVIIVAALAAMAGLLVFFGRTFIGTALRATAVNRLGAQLVGIPPALAGQMSFLLAGFIGALCGILIGPVTTIYYDTGFTIALKGFVAAVLGALASYPVTAIAAVGVGILESFASFTASQYKEVIVFGLIVPALLLRSLLSKDEDHDE